MCHRVIGTLILSTYNARIALASPMVNVGQREKYGVNNLMLTLSLILLSCSMHMVPLAKTSRTLYGLSLGTLVLGAIVSGV